MKITKEEREIEPLTITLETEAEIRFMKTVMNCIGGDLHKSQESMLI